MYTKKKIVWNISRESHNHSLLTQEEEQTFHDRQYTSHRPTKQSNQLSLVPFSKHRKIISVETSIMITVHIIITWAQLFETIDVVS